MKLILLFTFLMGLALAQTKDASPRQLTPVEFANLGTPANGTIVYCTDCTAANPTASGGTGAVVRRENGVWNGGGASLTGDGSKITVTGSVISTTSELPGRSEAAVILAARDLSGAGQFIEPRGIGAPPSTGCDSAAEVGNKYNDSTATGSVSGHYVCTASGGTPAWVELPRTGGGGTFNTTDQGWWAFGPVAWASGGAVQSITALTQFRPRYYPYRALATETVRQVVMYGASGSSGNVRVGIYDSGCNLLAQSATTAVSAGAAVAATFSPAQTLSPGYYYLALVSDTVGGGLVGGAGSSTVDHIVINGGTSTSQTFEGPVGGSITLPATCGTRTAPVGNPTFIAAMWMRP